MGSLPHLDDRQKLMRVNAASENAQIRGGLMEGTQNDGEQLGADESETLPTGKRKCWNGRQKDSKIVRCTLLNGSAWSTEKKYMRR